jgi:hypothetical protein
VLFATLFLEFKNLKIKEQIEKDERIGQADGMKAEDLN